MKSKKVVLIFTLLSVISLLVQGAAWGSASITTRWGAIKADDIDKPVLKADRASAAPGAAVKNGFAKIPFPIYKYIMVPGDEVTDVGTLRGYDDSDLFIFRLNGVGAWLMTITDCCTMGDTMEASGWVAGTKLSSQVTSPDSIVLGPVAIDGSGIGFLKVKYTDCPGGFPAGYDFTIQFLAY